MKVLIVEDNPEISTAIGVTVQIRWPDVRVVTTHLGERGVEMVESEKPDLVILDLGLPDISGYEVLKRVRLFSVVPVLVLTVRSDEDDVVKALEYGADDYMIKPFRKLELLSRVQALLRRYSTFQEQGEGTLSCGLLSLDTSTGKLIYSGKEVRLTNTERRILQHLMRNCGHVVTYSSLAEAVWGNDYPDAADSLKVYVRRLREKVETDPSDPKIILTTAGIGYSLAAPEKSG
ncbi:MAG: response regulator transcription factor [Dehalococcoidales bacterium]|nr:response regulator transcription factor [Dehalococcoidales bacterium]